MDEQRAIQLCVKHRDPVGFEFLVTRVASKAMSDQSDRGSTRFARTLPQPGWLCGNVTFCLSAAFSNG